MKKGAFKQNHMEIQKHTHTQPHAGIHTCIRRRYLHFQNAQKQDPNVYAHACRPRPVRVFGVSVFAETRVLLKSCAFAHAYTRFSSNRRRTTINRTCETHLCALCARVCVFVWLCLADFKRFPAVVRHSAKLCARAQWARVSYHHQHLMAIARAQWTSWDHLVVVASQTNNEHTHE